MGDSPLSMLQFLWQSIQELVGDAEGTFGYGMPEVGVLLPMFVGPWCVADDAETDEGHVVEVAHLGNGA